LDGQFSFRPFCILEEEDAPCYCLDIGLKVFLKNESVEFTFFRVKSVAGDLLVDREDQVDDIG
jgi:hypothetical protein